ncbi:MAG: LysM peptidoglycan-binding domain-containing protein [bacterium]
MNIFYKYLKICFFLFLGGIIFSACTLMKDVEVRSTLDQLKSDLKEFDDSVEARLASISEDIRNLREKFTEFKGGESEKSFYIKRLEERVDILSKEMSEKVAQISFNQKESIDSLKQKDSELVRQLERLNKLEKEVEEFKIEFKDQTENTKHSLSNVEAKISVIIEEINKASTSLSKEIAQYKDYVNEVKKLVEELNKNLVPQQHTPISAGRNRYIVQNGDTLSGIAKKHNISIETIMKANNMDDPGKLSIGQELFIP